MTRAAYEPTNDQWAGPEWSEEGPTTYRTPGRAGLAGVFGRLGPVGVAALVAGVLFLFGAGAVAYSLGRDASSAKAPAAAPAAPSFAPVGSPDPVVPAPVDSTSGDPSASPSRSAPSSAAVAGDAGLENALAALINSERGKARSKCRQPLRVDGRLRTAARAHSTDMAAHNFVNHTGSDRSSADSRMRAAGYPDPLSENLARGGNSANDVFNAWARNATLRKAMLDCGAKAVGIGVAVAGGVAYWTADFGRS